MSQLQQEVVQLSAKTYRIYDFIKSQNKKNIVPLSKDVWEHCSDMNRISVRGRISELVKRGLLTKLETPLSKQHSRYKINNAFCVTSREGREVVCPTCTTKFHLDTKYPPRTTKKN